MSNLSPQSRENALSLAEQEKNSPIERGVKFDLNGSSSWEVIGEIDSTKSDSNKLTIKLQAQ